MVIKLPKNVTLTNKTQSPVKTTHGTVTAKTEAQYAYKLFIDKISITLTLSEEHLTMVSQAVEAVIKHTGIFQKLKKFQKFKKSLWAPGYQINRFISCSGTSERVVFQFGPKTLKPPHCRLEFNPDKMGFDGISGLGTILGEIFPGGWDYVVKNGRVSRIDVAADLHGVRMDQFLFLPHQGATYREFLTNGHLETFYFGTSKRNQTRIYSKDKEQKAKGKLFGKSIVRVEQTLRNLNITIAELQKLKNPFAKMILTENMPKWPAPGLVDTRLS